MAARNLKDLGYQRVSSMAGGFTAWKRQGLSFDKPTAKGASDAYVSDPAHPVPHLPRPVRFADVDLDYDDGFYGDCQRALRAVPRSRPFASRDDLRAITAPTVVVADRDEPDPGHPLAVGELYASLIPGARLVMLEGMGHDMPPALWPQIIDAICENAGAPG